MLREVTRRPIVAIAAAIIASCIVLLPSAALAACHIAAFSPETYSVNESAGSVTLTVELTNRQPTCEGTVQYATKNGSAVAPGDYSSKSGTLTFVAADDREETIMITIKEDALDEPNESFTVELSNPTGSISGVGSPATVTIADNDVPAPASPTASATPTARRTTASPSPSATASPSPSPSPSPAVTTAPSDPLPSPSPVGRDPLAAPDEPGRGSALALVAALLGVLAIAAAGVVFWMRRG